MASKAFVLESRLHGEHSKRTLIQGDMEAY